MMTAARRTAEARSVNTGRPPRFPTSDAVEAKINQFTEVPIVRAAIEDQWLVKRIEQNGSLKDAGTQKKQGWQTWVESLASPRFLGRIRVIPSGGRGIAVLHLLLRIRGRSVSRRRLRVLPPWPIVYGRAIRQGRLIAR